MAALRQRANTLRTIGNTIRRSVSTHAKESKSFVVPFLAGTLVAGSASLAAYAYTNNKVPNVLSCVEASAPMGKSTQMERTFIMIKPDGVARGLIADIVKRFEQRGYKLVAMKMMKADTDLLNEHYGDLKAKAFFPGLIRHISSGPVVAMVWEGKNVVKQGRQMLGETDPLKSKPGSIRGDFSIDMGRNIIHGSDSVDSANAEIALWFKPSELMDYCLPLEGQVFE